MLAANSVKSFGLVGDHLINHWSDKHFLDFHNKGIAAKPILWEFLRLFPTPQQAVHADCKQLAKLFQPLGLHRKRAEGIIRFSGGYCP